MPSPPTSASAERYALMWSGGKDSALALLRSRARNVNVTFRIEDFQSSTSSAEARLVGTYEYTNSDGKGDTQPVIVSASFQREGNNWRLVAIR